MGMKVFQGITHDGSLYDDEEVGAHGGLWHSVFEHAQGFLELKLVAPIQTVGYFSIGLWFFLVNVVVGREVPLQRHDAGFDLHDNVDAVGVLAYQINLRKALLFGILHGHLRPHDFPLFAPQKAH